MHHSDELSERMKEEASRLGLGATGEYPHGKLDRTDQGELKAGVTLRGSAIIINFGKPVAWLALTPDLARGLATVLLEKAKQADGR